MRDRCEAISSEVEQKADEAESKPKSRAKAAKLKPGEDAATLCHPSDSYNVAWLDYAEGTAASKRLMPQDSALWEQKMTESGCLEAWRAAVESFDQGVFTRLPEAALLRTFSSSPASERLASTSSS